MALLAVAVTGSACGGRSPVAPTSTQQVAAAQLATISGRVYAAVTWGEPPIAETLIEVTEADGTTTTVLSDDDGFYQVTVRHGSVSISASKEGYEAKTPQQFTLLNDAVLNFSLTPR